jgi:hypothetical protein
MFRSWRPFGSVLSRRPCRKLHSVSEILGTRCNDNEEYYLLGCDAVQSGRSLPKFRRNVLPSSSGSKQLAVCLLELLLDPQDGSSSFLQSVCKLQLDYTASHPRRQYPSFFAIGWEKGSAWWLVPLLFSRIILHFDLQFIVCWRCNANYWRMFAFSLPPIFFVCCRVDHVHLESELPEILKVWHLDGW